MCVHILKLNISFPSSFSAKQKVKIVEGETNKRFSLAEQMNGMKAATNQKDKQDEIFLNFK